MLSLVGTRIYQRISYNRTLAPIKLALSVASETGLEYPQARPLSEEMRERYRDEGFGDRLDLSLELLRTKFDADKAHSPETAFWLAAGLIALEELETARAAVDIGRVHNPFDQDLWALDVILTRAEGKTEQAKERLETLIEMFPENDLALRNLAKLDSS